MDFTAVDHYIEWIPLASGRGAFSSDPSSCLVLLLNGNLFYAVLLPCLRGAAWTSTLFLLSPSLLVADRDDILALRY
jgi:hypothetical protein